MAEFNHFDTDGNAQMVDVGGKADTNRIAIVKGYIKMQPETLAMIADGTAKKGDVLGVARLAGIMGQSKLQISYRYVTQLGLIMCILILCLITYCPVYRLPQLAPYQDQRALKWKQ